MLQAKNHLTSVSELNARWARTFLNLNSSLHVSFVLKSEMYELLNLGYALRISPFALAFASFTYLASWGQG